MSCFFFKQKTAYEMRISDVCSSDLAADPVDVGQPRRAYRERGLRADHESPRFGFEPDDVERFGLAADLDSAPLADGEMDQPAMLAELAPCLVDDIARCVRLGPELLHQRRIIAIGDEADVLAVGLGGDPQAQFGRDLAHPRLGQRAEREAQEIELRGGGREMELALVARRIDRAVQFGWLVRAPD